MFDQQPRRFWRLWLTEKQGDYFVQCPNLPDDINGQESAAYAPSRDEAINQGVHRMMCYIIKCRQAREPVSLKHNDDIGTPPAGVEVVDRKST